MFLLVVSFCLTLATAQDDSTVALPPRDNDVIAGDVIAEMRLRMREEHLDLREEIYEILGKMLPGQGLAVVVGELVGEVRYYRELAAQQYSEMAAQQAQQYKEAAAQQAQQYRELAAQHTEQYTETQQYREDMLERMESCSTELVSEMSSKLGRLETRMDVVRDEVRLVSQYKLTWANQTNAYLQPEYAVDGVYTRTGVFNTDNPIYHSNSHVRNNLLIIDLGGIFKIHSVLVWNRIDFQTENNGVFVFADETLLGAITEVKDLYKFKAVGTVYARKAILKQTSADNLTVLEVQVYGTGPFGKDEIE